MGKEFGCDVCDVCIHNGRAEQGDWGGGDAGRQASRPPSSLAAHDDALLPPHIPQPTHTHTIKQTKQGFDRDGLVQLFIGEVRPVKILRNGEP